jgi:hypothetical protein
LEVKFGETLSIFLCFPLLACEELWGAMRRWGVDEDDVPGATGLELGDLVQVAVDDEPDFVQKVRVLVELEHALSVLVSLVGILKAKRQSRRV